MVVNPDDRFSHLKAHKMVVCYRCVEQVMNSQYIDLAHDLEIDKLSCCLLQVCRTSEELSIHRSGP